MTNNTHSFAVLFLEYQNEWLSPDGKLYKKMVDSKQFQSSVQTSERLLKFARSKHCCIIHSGLAFTSNYSELGQAKVGLNAAIPLNRTFIEQSFGSQFHPTFKPEDSEFIVAGRLGSSAFSASNLDGFLRNNRINRLYILGYALHVCIESTIRAGHDLGYRMTLITDATSAFTAEQYEHSISHTLPHFCDFATTESFMNQHSEVLS